MGYRLDLDGFSQVITEISKSFKIFAPVTKKGKGRFTDTDVIIYDEVKDSSEIELAAKSDYSFKEAMTPLSETLFFFTEDHVNESSIDERPVLVFLRSCDLHALKRQDQIYLENGASKDPFYLRRREKLHFALIGCKESFENCFCVSMGTNTIKDGYDFSINVSMDGEYLVDVPERGSSDSVSDGISSVASSLNNEPAPTQSATSAATPSANGEPAVTQAGDAIDFDKIFSVHSKETLPVVCDSVKENMVKVHIPTEIPTEIFKDSLWDEYSSRCIGCGRCNFVCPTCTCYNMQDVYYTDNGKVGERRRVAASCMVDGFTNVAGGGQYRKTQGERMRFKVLHKIYDHRKRFGNDMCVGCGRCDDVCPEYISYTNIIKKVDAAASKYAEEKTASDSSTASSNSGSAANVSASGNAGAGALASGKE